MFIAHNHSVARACLMVGVGHCAVDASRFLRPIREALEALPTAEILLLAVATIAILAHLLIHRSRFAITVAAAHAANVLIGWLHILHAHLPLPATANVLLRSDVWAGVLILAVTGSMAEMLYRRLPRPWILLRRLLRGRTA